MAEAAHLTDRVKTSAELCLDTLEDLKSFRHEIVIDLRNKSKTVDNMATGTRAGKIVGIGLILLSPLTLSPIPAIAGTGVIYGASVLSKVFSEVYKKEMEIKLEEDKQNLYKLKKQVHDFNINCEAFTECNGIPEDVRKYVIETSRLAGFHDPEHVERIIPLEIGNRIVALLKEVYKENCGKLADEMRSIAFTVTEHFPDLNRLEEGLRKISRKL